MAEFFELRERQRMRVLARSRRRDQQVAAVARELLALAEEGDLQGIAFVIKLGPDDHRAGVVGEYQERPGEAILACLRMQQRLVDAG